MGQHVVEHRRFTEPPGPCPGFCHFFHPNADLVAATYNPPGERPVLVLHTTECDGVEPVPAIDIEAVLAEAQAAIAEARGG